MNGFRYASGPLEMEARKPGSAFSKGDLLCLDSNSSLSRLNPYAVAAGTVFAIAAADSIDSIQNEVTCYRVTPQTTFWSRTTSGVTLITGEESGVSFIAAAPGRYYVDESATTNVVVILKGTAQVDQSHESKVLVRFKYADSELDLS